MIVQRLTTGHLFQENNTRLKVALTALLCDSQYGKHEDKVQFYYQMKLK